MTVRDGVKLIAIILRFIASGITKGATVAKASTLYCTIKKKTI